MALFGGYVVLNYAEIEETLHGEAGPVMRHLVIVGERIKTDAVSHYKTGFPRDFLAPRTVKRVVRMGDGPHVLVGVEGAKTGPHIIAKSPGVMAFNWPKKGAAVLSRGKRGIGRGGSHTLYMGPALSGVTGGMTFVHTVHHPGSDFTVPTEAHHDGYVQELLLKALERAVI
jgi:hypothetical protein